MTLVLTTGCANRETQGNPPESPTGTGKEGPDIGGYVREIIPVESGGTVTPGYITGGIILIGGSRGRKSPTTKARVTVLPDTGVLRERDSDTVPASFDELRAGMKVEAYFRDPVAESYPVQAAAAKVIILSESS